MLQPNPTLYIKNIDWKVKKTILRRALYALFTRHGKLLEVVALRKDGLRGQAFVVFEDVNAASAALQAENGLNLFGKDLVIEYAKEPSRRHAKGQGGASTASKRKAEPKEVKDEEPVTKKPKVEEAKIDVGTPSPLLIAKDLPEECNNLMMEMLFRQYKGFTKSEMPRTGICLISFESEPTATAALQAMQGFALTANDKLTLTYGKV